MKYGVKGQTREARLARLEKGRCPVHGNHTYQVESWFTEQDPRRRRTLGPEYTIAKCARKACDIQIRSYSIDGPHELMPEWAHILAEQEGVRGNIIPFPDGRN